MAQKHRCQTPPISRNISKIKGWKEHQAGNATARGEGQTDQDWIEAERETRNDQTGKRNISCMSSNAGAEQKLLRA
jgi:hypothetical protein